MVTPPTDEIPGSTLIQTFFPHAEEVCLILTCMQMPYAFETSNNVVGYGNPHERI
jgi:hypothetical protein